MIRGYSWAKYTADDGSQWALLVDADYISQPERGWGEGDAEGLYPVPRGWLPRKVMGIDSSGRIQTAIVASVDAPLWTGAVSTFSVESTDGTTATCVVTKRLQERSNMRP